MWREEGSFFFVRTHFFRRLHAPDPLFQEPVFFDLIPDPLRLPTEYETHHKSDNAMPERRYAVVARSTGAESYSCCGQ